MLRILTLYLNKAAVHKRRNPVTFIKEVVQRQLPRVLLTLDDIFWYLNPFSWCYLGWVKSRYTKGWNIYGKSPRRMSQTQTVKHTQLKWLTDREMLLDACYSSEANLSVPLFRNFAVLLYMNCKIKEKLFTWAASNW